MNTYCWNESVAALQKAQKGSFQIACARGQFQLTLRCSLWPSSESSSSKHHRQRMSVQGLLDLSGGQFKLCRNAEKASSENWSGIIISNEFFELKSLWNRIIHKILRSVPSSANLYYEWIKSLLTKKIIELQIVTIILNTKFYHIKLEHWTIIIEHNLFNFKTSVNWREKGR